MKSPKLIYLSALFFLILNLFSASVSAKDEWLQVRSKNFNLIGNAGEKDIRKVATKLEQFRETFRQLFANTNLNASIPTNVIVFKSGNAYKPFKPKRADGKIDNFIAGYFQPGEDVNYITISTEGEDADTYGTIFHEYVHFIINTNFGKSEVPPWFNEGLAEYYQTFEIDEDQKVKLGLPQSNHLALLQQSKLIPLETFFKISNYSLHQNENHSRSIFYAQAWALIHYLIQGGKAENLNNFLKLALRDVPSEKAFEEAFQMNYAQMEKQLQKYVSLNSYKYLLVSFKTKLVFENEMQSLPISESVTNTYLGDLLYHTNRADDAEPFLQKAVELEPESSMANTAFGMVKMRQRKFDDAKNYFEKAISEDQKNHLAFYNYAYLLSRDGRDEFGYVRSFPAEQAAKMRQLLKKAMAINPAFTGSYDLIAFVSLVNNEELEEAVSYLKKALQYQPGNQKYSIRIGEIYMRQNKFAEAKSIAEKIAQTSDDPQVKAQAENLLSQLQQREEIEIRNEAARKLYEEASAKASENGGRTVLVRRSADGKLPTPEELAAQFEEEKIYSVNQSLRKAEPNEKQVVGRIQKIDCKNNVITYTVKTEDETFSLSSKNFESLALIALVENLENTQVGCNANIAAVNSVLTYKPVANAKNANHGELIAIDFVPNNFRFMDVSKPRNDIEENSTTLANPPPPSPVGDGTSQRKEAMKQAIKNALRQPQTGEKRELGFIEKVECSSKGMFFILKNAAQEFKLSAASPQSIMIRGFTPEIEQLQLGCSLKNVEVPVIFTFKDEKNPKTKSDGEIVSLEFVPKGFELEK